MNNIITEVKEELEKLGYEVAVREQKKNGDSYPALFPRKPGDMMGPVIPFGWIEHEYYRGSTVSELTSLVEGMMHPEFANPTIIREETYKDYEKIKDKLIIRLRGEYEDELPGIPWRNTQLKSTFVLDIDERYSIPVNEMLLNMWGKTLEEIYPVAFENSKKVYGKANIVSWDIIMADQMPDVFKEELINMPDELVPPDMKNIRNYLLGCEIEMVSPLWYIRTESPVNGATAIIFDETIEAIREKIGDDFYLIPSTVDDLLVIPAKYWQTEASELLTEVNQNVASFGENLSDIPIHYKDGIVSVVIPPSRIA